MNRRFVVEAKRVPILGDPWGSGLKEFARLQPEDERPLKIPFCVWCILSLLWSKESQEEGCVGEGGKPLFKRLNER